MRSDVGFIAPVEGLRGVAVLLVILFHYVIVLDARFADPWVAAIDAWLPTKVIARNGMIGVDLFFLITGFLLVLPWLVAADEGRASPSASEFYRRRVRRIVPAYYVHLVFLFLVALPLLRGLEFWRYNTAHVLQNLSAHVFFVHYSTPVTSASLSINGALWTLSLEAQFYLLLPLLAPLFARAPWRTAATMLAMAIVWRWLAAHSLDGIVAWMRAIEPRWNISEAGARHLLGTQLPAYLGHFAAGMLGAHAWMNWRGSPPTRANAAAWTAAAIGAIVVIWLLHAPGNWVFGPWTWIVVLAALATVFFALIARGIPLAQPLLANRPLSFMGRISYSAYLYHLPLLLLWNAHAPDVKGSLLVFPLYLAAVMGVAWLSYCRVELPNLGYREREPTSRAAAMASV